MKGLQRSAQIFWLVFVCLFIAMAMTLPSYQRQGTQIQTAGAVTYHGPKDTHAFSKPSANMPAMKKADFFIGDSLFQRSWISSPSSVGTSDGLGPMFNSRACQSCHIKDGRGHLPHPDDDSTRSVIVKLALSASPKEVMGVIHKGKQAVIAKEPIYGGQFHDRALPGVLREGFYTISHDRKTAVVGNGKAQRQVTLKRPKVKFTELNYGKMAPDVVMSLRVAPPMIGLGLVEAIAAQDIMQRHDPHDRDGDGISARASWLEGNRLGRFGWKASTATLMEQNLTAFFMDMSMTSSLHPESEADCTQRQTTCRRLSSHSPQAEPDIPSKMADLILFYTQNLAPPQRVIGESVAKIERGESVFYDIGCESCHRASYQTSNHHPLEYLRNQQIFVYSDFLLHDMGPGLDDGLHEPHALASEWKTPPLWGLGYTKIINPQAGFLHDGRANTIEEAILWHGGEAEKAKDAYRELSEEERQALLAFLGSL